MLTDRLKYVFFVQLSDAKKMYINLFKDKKPFPFEHCWNILKEEDKWKAKMVEIAEEEKLKAKKKEKAANKSRPRNEGPVNNDQVIALDAEEPEGAKEPRKRSDGIKKVANIMCSRIIYIISLIFGLSLILHIWVQVKYNLKGGGGQACMEALDSMWSKKEAFDKVKEKAKEERFMATLEIEKATLELEKTRVENDAKKFEATLEVEKKRVENEAKKAEADLLKEENKIMLVDMANLNPRQIEWMNIMQEKILAKHAAY
jgi:hypothetical protein